MKVGNVNIEFLSYGRHRQMLAHNSVIRLRKKKAPFAPSLSVCAFRPTAYIYTNSTFCSNYRNAHYAWHSSGYHGNTARRCISEIVIRHAYNKISGFWRHI